MLGPVWLCVLALALPCWAFPSENITTCDEFGRGISFDPMNAVGEWFTVYSFGDIEGNVTENRTIRVFTSSQLELMEPYDRLLRGYSKDKLKLEMKIHRVSVREYELIKISERRVTVIAYEVVEDTDYVLVPQDNAGNAVAWDTHAEECMHTLDGESMCTLKSGPTLNIFKWKSVDGFLVIMGCSYDYEYVDVLSKSATPDEDKLQRAVDSLHIEGITGQRLYA